MLLNSNISYENIPMLTVMLNMVLILVGVAFNTLLERKVLGYIQLRKGPNKVSFMGFFQPFSDAIKLYTNEITFVKNFNSFFFYISPMFMLLLMLTIWLVVPILDDSFFIKEEVLFIFCCLSAGVYPLIMCGWSSYSNYAMIGAIRAISQMVSYEVILIMLTLTVVMFNDSFSLVELIEFQEYNKYLFWMFIVSNIFLISMLGELNRTPFDLVEGESELVSGFNIEYSSGIFGMIFMAEYGMIMFSSFFFVFIFLGLNMESLMFYLFMFFMNFSIIWVRGSLPRMRYDMLMMLCWKHLLLFVLGNFYFYIVLKMYIEFVELS